MAKNNQPSQDADSFSKRLNTALDGAQDVPALNAGRGVWLAKRFKVTEGSCNGWLTGRFMPKPDRVRKLAELCGVSYDWLYFGTPSQNGAQKSHSLHNPVLSENGSAFSGKGSQSTRLEDVTLAFRLAAEALGRDLSLPPAQYAELGTLIFDLLRDGLDEAQVLSVARRTINALHRGEHESGRKSPEDPRAAG